MSRSGYSYDGEPNYLWRGAVERAIQGKRGQAFLREMLVALDALPEKRLIAEALELNGEYCAMGAVARARGTDVSYVDPEDIDTMARTMGIAPALASEVAYVNDDEDDSYYYPGRTPGKRWQDVRAWVVRQLKEPL